jgi:hypothetical protein
VEEMQEDAKYPAVFFNSLNELDSQYLLVIFGL